MGMGCRSPDVAVEVGPTLPPNSSWYHGDPQQQEKGIFKRRNSWHHGRAGVTLRCPEMMKQFWKTESRWDYVDRNEGNLSPTCVQKMPRMLRSAAEKLPSPLPAITEAEGGPSANRKVITELPTEPLSQWL